MKKTILITGVSKGLGRSLALEMAKRGHTVIGCSRSQDTFDSLMSEDFSIFVSDPTTPSPSTFSSSSSSLDITHHLLMDIDVTSDSDVEEFARTVKDKKIIPNIIVNNAGTFNGMNKMWEIPAEEFDAVIDTNIIGTANMLRHFIPLMLEADHQGIIVNMSSEWGRSAAGQIAPYCASKWGVEGLTKSIAKELPVGMTIVALSPGAVNTEMLQTWFGNSAVFSQTPEEWAGKAATMILNFNPADNGASRTV